MVSGLSFSAPLQSVGARRAWPALMIAAAGIFTFSFVCVVPLAAVAAFAARTLSARKAALTVVGAVAANQAVGFLLLNFPHTAACAAWGVFGLVATLGAFGVAARIAQPIVAAVAAFVAYEAILAAFSLVTSHSLAAFAPVFLGNAAFANLVGLAVLGVVYAIVNLLDHARIPTAAKR